MTEKSRITSKPSNNNVDELPINVGKARMPPSYKNVKVFLRIKIHSNAAGSEIRAVMKRGLELKAINQAAPAL